MIHKRKSATETTVERIKEVSKRAQQGPEQLCNENQETIFNNDLSNAADGYAKAVKESKLWKEKLTSTKRELITEMKKAKLVKMTMGSTKVIKYKYTDAKEDIVLMDFKPKVPRRRRM